MADKIVRTSQEGESQQQGFDNVQVELNSVLEKFENIEFFEKEQKSPKPATDGVLHTIQSQAGTPNLGSEKIEPPAWKSGLPTPVQGLSLNSTTLLAGFAKGNIQMQGEAVKHLQEGNLAKLSNVTIELMEPNGKVLGTIENVNFLEGSTEKVKEPTIEEMLSELE